MPQPAPFPPPQTNKKKRVQCPGVVCDLATPLIIKAPKQEDWVFK